MNQEEKTRMKYWKAVMLLREIIDGPYMTKEEILQELEDDLEK